MTTGRTSPTHLGSSSSAMVASLSFEPLADDEATNSFESTSIDLPTQYKLYVLGFRRNPLRPGHDEISEIGFSDTLEDDMFCIVPVESDEAQKIKDPLAVIWLAPGYKVMIIPAEGSKIYYQRALDNNNRWSRIKNGWGFDLADPLLTALDGAIHVKIDTRPDNRRRAWFKRKLEKYVTRRKAHTEVVKHIEAGKLEGVEEHEENRAHQITAKVSVSWGKNIASKPPELVDASQGPGTVRSSSRSASSPSIIMNSRKTEVPESLTAGEMIAYSWGYDSDNETVVGSDAEGVVNPNSDSEPVEAVAGKIHQTSTITSTSQLRVPTADARTVPAEGHGDDYLSAVHPKHSHDQTQDGNEADEVDLLNSDEQENGRPMTPRAGPIAPSQIKRSSSHHLHTPKQRQNIEKQASFYDDSKRHDRSTSTH